MPAKVSLGYRLGFFRISLALSSYVGRLVSGFRLPEREFELTRKNYFLYAMRHWLEAL